MAGTIPLSMTQQFDEFGKPLSGGLLYIIQAATVATPQNAYQDAALTIPMPYPMELDAAGRVPQFFLADGYVKIRLVDKYGVVQLARDGVLVIGPSVGGGGGGGVDPTTLIQTGMIALFWATGQIAGFVRANGRSIGSALSGATERANNDCQALFLFLWQQDTNLVVLPIRGASAAADWAANKQLFLPDMRGRVIGGLDDMGNALSGRLTATYFFTNPAVLGAGGGLQQQVLFTANLPAYIPAGVIVTNSVVNSDPGTKRLASSVTVGPLGYGGVATGGQLSATDVTVTSTSTFTGNPQGGTSLAFSLVQPTILLTTYVKL